MPQPQGTIEQDGSLTVQTPANVELLSGLETSDGLELQRQTPHEQSWRCPRRAPQQIEASWRPYRPPVSVLSLADVTLTGRQGRVRQELRYELPDTAAAPPLLVRVPDAATGLHWEGAELAPRPGG